MRQEAVSTSEAVVDVPIVGGRYRLHERLGKGGMGEVFRATDERTGETVALKRRLSSGDGARRYSASMFEREYHALSALRHPCIVRVKDYGLDAGGAYYTMELLDGRDLRDGAQLSWRAACQVLYDVASATAILHSRRLLHGDLSTRNVRYTESGRSKLIDFGTMTPMGVAKVIAGTPPFLAPEVLAQQTLDGRADLFAIGAIGYWMLTGRHAFPARTLEQLGELWKRPLAEPHRIDQSVPAALGQLVMELLRLDRMARPSSAAVVMERLGAITELRVDEGTTIGQAYLAIPSLVGRAAQLQQVRGALGESARGVSLVLCGDSGTGRSRLLDECVLEAKMLGKSIARASAQEAEGESYGAVKLLAAELLREAPEVVRVAARAWQTQLGHVVPELEADSPSRPPPPERRHLQTALGDWFLSVARRRPLVLAVDDFDEIDEPSAALLAGLSHRASRRDLTIVATLTPGASSPAVRVLKENGIAVPLAPLDQNDTEALLRSVFGDADNVVGVAHHVHDLCDGRPREAMELLQHLVDRGLARYAAGSWVLPRKLSAGDLRQLVPAGRLSELGALARRLGEVLSLTEPRKVRLETYPALIDADARDAFHALEELVARGVLTQAGPAFRFSHPGWSEALAGGLAPRDKQDLHARLARLTEPTEDPLALAHHLLEAGLPLDAVDVVLRHKRAVGANPEAPALIGRLLDASRDLSVPWSRRLALRQTLVVSAANTGAVEAFWRFAPEVARQLRHDSGLEDYRELAAQGVPENERLMKALARVEQRYAETPDAERGLPVQAAIKQLAVLSSSFMSMASVSMDVAPLHLAPSFEPFYVLAPPLRVLERSLRSLRAFLTTHNSQARKEALEIVNLLNQPDRGGVDETIAESVKCGMLYMVGAMDAFDGLPNATRHVAELENRPGFRGNAWRVRRVAYMMQGDFDEARKCQRQAEIFELLDGEQQALPGTAIRLEAAAQWMVGDIVRLRESLERITELARVFPRWENTRAMVHSHYRRLQGDAEGALEVILPALDRCAPGQDPDWPWVAGAHVLALSACERHAEAAAKGTEYHALSAREELTPVNWCLIRPVCEARLGAGNVEEALQLIERGIAELESQEVTGLWLGGFYETRARVAIAMDDEAAFEDYAARCAAQYQRGKNSTLVANYERLLELARNRSLSVSTALLHAAEFTRDPASSSIAGTTVAGVLSRLRHCTNRSERAECALEAIIEETGALRGHLFGVCEAGLERFASIPRDLDVPDTLRAELEEHLAECTNESETQTLAPADHEVTALARMPAANDSEPESPLVPTLILAEHGHSLVVVAIAALEYESEAAGGSDELLRIVGRALVSHHDVSPTHFMI